MIGWSDVPCAKNSLTSASSSCCLLALAMTDTGTFGGSAELLLLVVSGSHVIPNAFLMVRCATTLEGATYITTHHTVATRSRCSGVLNNRNFIAHLLLGLGVKEFRKSVARVTVTVHIHNHQRVQFFLVTPYMAYWNMSILLVTG